MNCPDSELISAYFDGRASAEERRLLDSHKQTCVACQKSLRVLSLLRERLAAQRVPPMPESLRSSLQRMAEEAAQPQSEPISLRNFWTLIPRPALGLALIVLSIVAGTLLWQKRVDEISARAEGEVSEDALLAAHDRYQRTMPLAEEEVILARLTTEDIEPEEKAP